MLEFTNLREYALSRYGIDIIKRCRKADNVRLRQAISTILYSTLQYKAVDIGRRLLSDHTMVVYYRNTHDIRYKFDSRYADMYEELLRVATPSEESLKTIFNHIHNLC